MVLHIAVVLQSLELGPQNEGGGFNNTGDQIKDALGIPFVDGSRLYLCPTPISS